MDAKFHKGDTIVFVPRHAEGKITHPDVEYGVVAAVSEASNSFVFCRYFRRGEVIRYENNPLHLYEMLRTKANSEATPVDMLVKIDGFLDRDVVEKLLDYLGYTHE